MRQYTLVFMEPRREAVGHAALDGLRSAASFIAVDDAAAIDHVRTHFLEQLRLCERADLSSLRIVPDLEAPGGRRLVDDTLQNPHFQDTCLRYNPASNDIEIDFESTETGLIEDFAVLRR